AMNKAVSDVHYITMALVIVTAVVGIIMPEQFEVLTTNVKASLSTSSGFYYVWLMSALVFLTMIIAVSRYGKLKSSKADDEPEFSIPTWIAMLFSAGLGIGLVFYGASERLSHEFSHAPF